MLENVAAVVAALDRDDIEPAVGVVHPVLRQIPLGDFPNLLLFRRGDRLFGTPVDEAGSGFDLDKNNRRTIPGDDIDFAPVKVESRFEDDEVFFPQVTEGHLFAEMPQGMRRSGGFFQSASLRGRSCHRALPFFPQGT